MTAQDTTQTDIRLNLRIILGTLLFSALMICALFPVSGDWGWVEAWVLILLAMTLSLLPRWIAARRHPGFLNERMKLLTAEGIKAWDRVLVAALLLPAPMAAWIVAALDRRFLWTVNFPVAWEFVGVAGYLLAGFWAGWAMVENAFFSSVVRIQSDRGQTVLQTGPYRLIRHPGYVGGILGALSTPLLLGSLWAFFPALLIVALYLVRTALEDRTLQRELTGYAEYAQNTRFRLIPGIW
jgi:protein-S-isoprenylcysteine O-methyltransferase Ste14